MWATEQYRKDLVKKMALDFKPNHRLLDIGCGDGEFTMHLAERYKLRVKAIDLTAHKNWGKIASPDIQFKKGSIYKLPFESNMFDYVFLKDILHHIDEPKHDLRQFKKAFQEVKRVCKAGGRIIILEANRYNPVFYPHMVILKGHDHLRYDKLITVVDDNFKNYKIKCFEAHVYPKHLVAIFKLYEALMDNVIFHKFRAYVAVDIVNGGNK